jgi:hypothetical protein
MTFRFSLATKQRMARIFSSVEDCGIFRLQFVFRWQLKDPENASQPPDDGPRYNCLPKTRAEVVQKQRIHLHFLFTEDTRNCAGILLEDIYLHSEFVLASHSVQTKHFHLFAVVFFPRLSIHNSMDIRRTNILPV